MIIEKDNQKPEPTDNLTQLEIDILEMQNKSLLTEICRLREEIKSKNIKEADLNLSDIKISRQMKEALKNLKLGFERLEAETGFKWARELSGFVGGVVDGLFCFEGRVDVSESSNKGNVDFNNKFSEIVKKINLELNGGKLKDDRSEEMNKVLKRVDERLKELEEKLSLLQKDDEESYILLEKYDSLKWKNNVLENRMSFISNIDKDDVKVFLQQIKDDQFDYCFCGGNMFKQLKSEFKEKIEKKIESLKVEPKEEIKDKKMDNGKEEAHKVTQLKANVADLITMAEKRLIDKKIVGKQILNSNFISEIKKYQNQYYDYVKELESKVETFARCLNQIDKERKDELEEYSQRENKEKARLSLTITNLRQTIADLNHQSRKKKSNKPSLDSTPTHKNTIKELESIIRVQNNKITNLKTGYYDKLETKLTEKEKLISYLEKKVYQLQESKLIGQKMLDKDFRHKTHSLLFSSIYPLFVDNPEKLEELKNMEKYIKVREDKIKSLERKLKRKDIELGKEKEGSHMLVDEVTNSSLAFTKLQGILEERSKDLKTTEENFNKIYREKNEEKLKGDKKVDSLNTEISVLKANINDLQEESRRLYSLVKDKEKSFANVESREKELTVLFNKLEKEKGTLQSEIDSKNAEISILENKIKNLEKSLKKLSSQISDNLETIAEKESIVKSIIHSAKGNNMDMNNMTHMQREELIVNNIEIKRLRSLVVCTVCNVNDRSIILKNCFHTFCRECIQTRLKCRDRNCPVCMIKINKFDIQKLYLG